LGEFLREESNMSDVNGGYKDEFGGADDEGLEELLGVLFGSILNEEVEDGNEPAFPESERAEFHELSGDPRFEAGIVFALERFTELGALAAVEEATTGKKVDSADLIGVAGADLGYGYLGPKVGWKLAEDITKQDVNRSTLEALGLL
jgi:hypothetical protein